MKDYLVPNKVVFSSILTTLKELKWTKETPLEFLEENDTVFRVSLFQNPDEYILVNKVDLSVVSKNVEFTLSDIIDNDEFNAMTFEERLELAFSTWGSKLKFEDVKREHVDLSVNDYLLNIEIKSHPFYKGIVHVRTPFTINEFCK